MFCLPSHGIPVFFGCRYCTKGSKGINIYKSYVSTSVFVSLGSYRTPLSFDLKHNDSMVSDGQVACFADNIYK